MMKRWAIKTRKFYQLSLLFFAVLLFCIYSLNERTTDNKSALVILTFAINLFFSSICFFSSVKKYPYSFCVMFWLFSIVFFSVAPLVQYLASWSAWGLSATDDEITRCNLLISLWQICFYIGTKINFRIQSINHKEYYLRFSGILIVLAISCAFSAILLYTNGIDGLLFRGSRVGISSNSTLSLLFFHVFRNTILYTFVFTLLIPKKRKTKRFLCFIAGFLFLLTCFPTSISRYMAGAFYFGMLIIFWGKDNCNIWFTILVFLGLTIAFPIFSIFRKIQTISNLNNIGTLANQAVSESFLTVNYDAHNMFISVRQYTQFFGFSYGRQLLGALLFFVPRTIWPGKPIGTGAMVISSLYRSSFTNVSMPLIGEAYVNFGVIGIVLFALAIGTASSYLDKKYWMCQSKIQTINIIYPFAVFYFFFLQRGDLLSSGAYLIANVVIGVLVSQLTTRRIKKI